MIPRRGETNPMLKNKKILVCVTGGIAAYKAAEFVRLLIENGATVRVAMTAAAQEFITPMTFQALTGKTVLTSLFSLSDELRIGHISVAHDIDAAVVLPCTANTIGKLAGGLADNIVTTLLMATRSPVVLAPAMNWAMWKNEIVTENTKKLSAMRRITVVPPGEGYLACGETGSGRLAELHDVLDATIYAARSDQQDMTDETVLITAGPTLERLDPVRFLTNRSSGKMGFALAREARARGAKVQLIAGPHSIPAPFDVETIEVESAVEMHKEVLARYTKAQVIIKSAAVADYRPERTQSSKIKKHDGDLTLNFVRTPDILMELGKKAKRGQYLVGFAAEDRQVLQNAKAKLKNKKLDLIVMNDISQQGAGFETDTNIVHIIDRLSHVESLPMMKKSEVARVILDHVQKRRTEAANKKKPTRKSSRGGSKSRGSSGKTSARRTAAKTTQTGRKPRNTTSSANKANPTPNAPAAPNAPNAPNDSEKGPKSSS